MDGIQEFADSIRRVIDKKITEIHTAVPGVIMRFIPSECRADICPVALYKTSEGRFVNYPVLHNVPVVFPCGGNSIITYPVEKGDSCLLIFSEKSLSLWENDYNSGDDVTHELSNAICIPGLMRVSNDSIAEASETKSIVIKNGRSKIVIGENGIEEMVDGFPANGKRCSFAVSASEWMYDDVGAVYNQYTEWARPGMTAFIAPNKVTSEHGIYAEFDESAIAIRARDIPEEDFTINLIVYPEEAE